MFRSTFLHAVGSALVMITIISSTTIFDTLRFDKGSDEYAEKPWPSMPLFCAMPLNTLVNLVYTIVGFYWLCRRRQHSANDNYSCAFAWMTITYSGIQFCRIATQQHIFCVLDQWYTLQMASYVLAWAFSLLFDDGTWSLLKVMMIEFLSCLSYPILVLSHSHGFEMALAVHLILIFSATIRLHSNLQKKNNASLLLCLICMGTICCTGFVLFDILEFYLAARWPSVFTVCSGHFLSRLCDTMQIHCVIALFTTIEDCKHKGRKIKMK